MTVVLKIKVNEEVCCLGIFVMDVKPHSMPGHYVEFVYLFLYIRCFTVVLIISDKYLSDCYHVTCSLSLPTAAVLLHACLRQCLVSWTHTFLWCLVMGRIVKRGAKRWPTRPRLVFIQWSKYKNKNNAESIFVPGVLTIFIWLLWQKTYIEHTLGPIT